MSNASATNGNAQVSVKKKSQIADTWKRLCRNKTAMLGLVIVILLVLISFSPPGCTLTAEISTMRSVATLSPVLSMSKKSSGLVRFNCMTAP